VRKPSTQFYSHAVKPRPILLGMNEPTPVSPRRYLKNRRSQRIELNVPVVVYREHGQGPQFYESTHTLVISAHGALIPLTDMVAPRQRLRMQNRNSGENLECRVVSVKKPPLGPPTVAVEFAKATPGFWRVAYPPPDWNTSSST
jgi:hypothetical protein